MEPETFEAKPSIRKNTIISLIISGIGYVYPILVFVYIAHILHPEGLGSASFAFSVASIFVIFTGLGMPLYGLRSVAEMRDHSPGGISELISELLIVRIVSGVVSWLVFLVVTRILYRSDETLLMLYGFSILFAILDCSWLYKGMEDYTPLAWISAIVRFGGLVALFLLVRVETDILKYAWISVLTPAVISLVEIVYAERKWNLQILRGLCNIVLDRKTITVICKHIRPLGYFLLMHCAVTVYTHTDTIMLGLLVNERAVGLYSCAAKIKVFLPVLTGTIYTVVLPRATELWNQRNKKAFQELSEKSFHVVYMVLLPLTVYFFLFSETWILLLGGAEYMDAAWTMRILLLAVLPIGLSNIVGGQLLLSMGREKELFQAEAIAAVANILLNVVLIPFFSTSGAAVATAIAEINVLVFTIFCLYKQIRIKIILPKYLCQSISGCLVAGLISYVVSIWLPDNLRGLISLTAFGLFFFMMMFLFHDTLFQEVVSGFKRLIHHNGKQTA